MNTNPSPNTVTYIITVHGMGKQRDNETLTPVASRFVDVIRDIDGTDKNSYPRNTLTLGQATGQEQAHPSDHWVAFKDVTLSNLGTGKSSFAFYGLAANPHTDPDCVRFADIYWQDILEKHCGLVAERTDGWVSAVVSRVFQNSNHSARLKSFINTLEQTVDILYYASKFKLKNLGSTIFEQYLGDVQVYTESQGCRNEALETFKKRMDTLHLSHQDTHDPLAGPTFKPRYIIIAHSLGTMMALEGLIEGAKNEAPWMNYVEGFITLGSPIEKITTLWDFNYDHLSDRIPLSGNKIPHYNYSDEQDPVGYYLNAIAKKETYRSIFEKKEDIVYNHSVIPGLAHTSYWKDIKLFRHIIRKIIVPSEAFDDTKMWFRKKTYTGVLGVTYFLIPFLISILNVLTLTLALSAKNWQSQAISSLLFILTFWFGKQILSLTIGWRLSANRGKIRPFSFDPQIRADLERYYVDKGAKIFLWLIMGLTTLLPSVFFLVNPFGFNLILGLSELLPFLATSGASLLLLFFFFRRKRRQQAIMGKFTINDPTAITVVLSFLLFMGSVYRGNVMIINDLTSPIVANSTAILFDVILNVPFPTGDAFALPQQPPRRDKTTIKYDTIHSPIVKYDTIHQIINRNNVVTHVVNKYDTVRKIIERTDTSSSPDNGVVIHPTVTESKNGALFYFAAFMNAFICFTFSTLKYIFEKAKLKHLEETHGR